MPICYSHSSLCRRYSVQNDHVFCVSPFPSLFCTLTLFSGTRAREECRIRSLVARCPISLSSLHLLHLLPCFLEHCCALALFCCIAARRVGRRDAISASTCVVMEAGKRTRPHRAASCLHDAGVVHPLDAHTHSPEFGYILTQLLLLLSPSPRNLCSHSPEAIIIISGGSGVGSDFSSRLKRSETSGPFDLILIWNSF